MQRDERKTWFPRLYDWPETMEESHSLFSEVKVLGRKGECQEAAVGACAGDRATPHPITLATTTTGHSQGDKGSRGHTRATWQDKAYRGRGALDKK